MSLAQRLTRTPHPFDPDAAQDIQTMLPGITPELRQLIQGAVGCSPYLNTLIKHEHSWLEEALETPESAMQNVLSGLDDVPPDQVEKALRQAKRRVALLTGLADLGGAWSLEEVTGTLTRFADTACQTALNAALYTEIRRGKLPGKTENDLENAAGMVVLAMGKMGAHELNYSSDIDLICLFDERQYSPDQFHDARASLIRATRKMSALLNDRTAEGYVFRTDLRLRPDPAVTPVCIAMDAAEQYYESLGRTWERAAYIKARACAGDQEAADRFLCALTPFVWRKHLDFAAIEDAHNMRLRIREHKGVGGTLTLPGHNMKLGRGGIREIEFFTQTRQLIAGGRDPDLRVRETVQGMDALRKKGWITQEVADILTENYRFHREVEHRLQMLRDAQTHNLPNSQKEFERLAAFMGRDCKDLMADLHKRLSEVHVLIEGFFTRQGVSPEESVPPDSTLDVDIINRWPNYPALRSERAETVFNRLKPDLLGRLEKAAHPKEALLSFDSFLKELPAGVQVFSLFESNPQLVDLLVDVFGTSPVLATYLSRNASVFDAVIAGDFFSPWPGRDRLVERLTKDLTRFADYEAKLDYTRRWNKEWHFRIGVHHLRGLCDSKVAARHYAELADAVLTVLFPVVIQEFARKHGPMPGRGAVILGMGSLGATRLSSHSDLDLIMIYDAAGVEASEGPRPLMSRQYYTRLTQAMITALTVPMAEGRLYEIDMRLRPSGNQGPVATSWLSFQDYQTNEAWVWEHLALTRSRVVTGSIDLVADIEQFLVKLLAKPSDAEKILPNVQEMRERIATAKTSPGLWDPKIGHGKLQDIELFTQAMCLIAGKPVCDVEMSLGIAVAMGQLSDANKSLLSQAYQLCWCLQMVARLIGDNKFEPEKLGEGGRNFLLRETGYESLSDLAQALDRITTQAGDAISASLQILPKEVQE